MSARAWSFEVDALAREARAQLHVRCTSISPKASVYDCTRATGHEGPHAHVYVNGDQRKVVAIWSDAADSTPSIPLTPELLREVDRLEAALRTQGGEGRSFAEVLAAIDDFENAQRRLASEVIVAVRQARMAGAK